MNRFRMAIAMSVCFSAAVNFAEAQNFEKAGDYFAYITTAQTSLGTKYMSYISAAAHGKRMKVVEKKRTAVIDAIDETRMKIYALPTFNGDKSLRDSAVSYLKLMHSVFNEDYGKIVDMEEIAEQSYDLMEAYLLAKEKVNGKIKEASARYDEVQHDFAKRNNINLIETQSELQKKLDCASRINNYYDKVYLIFFKANRQEAYLMEALKAKNTNAIEQNRNALIKCSEEGLERLKELKGYDNDQSLQAVCKKALEFYRDEADKKVPVLTDFIISAENFEQVKRSFESAGKTKENVDNYNKAVNDINKRLENYNAMNGQLNTKRNDVVSSYNNSVNAFFDVHMPYSN